MHLNIVSIVDLIFKALSLLIFIRVLLSWIPHNPYHGVVQFIYRVTEPILRPIQGIVPPSRMGGLDISPIIALFLLSLLKGAVYNLLL